MPYQLTLQDDADRLTFDLLEVPIIDTDIEGASDNTTLDGNIYTDYLWLKKRYENNWTRMNAETYARLHGFYARQWGEARYPSLSIIDITSKKYEAEIHSTGATIEYQNGIGITSAQFNGRLEQEMPGDLAWQGWAEDFVERIGSTRAYIETVDGRHCLWFMASAGYQEYDTKYMFKPEGGFEDNVQYKFTFDMKQSGTFSNLAIEYTDGTNDRTWTSAQAGEWTRQEKTTAPGKTVKYFRAHYAGGSCDIDIDSFKVEEISPTPTRPQPIETVRGDVEVDIDGRIYPLSLRSRNLLRNTLITTQTTTNGVTATPNPDGSISLSGTATALTWFVIAPSSLTFPAGTYTLSGGVSEVGLYNDSFGNTIQPTTKTFPNGTTGNWSLRVASGTNTNGVTIYPQLERGGTATPYETFYNYDLAEIGDYQDQIFKFRNTWYIEKKTRSVSLETLSWTSSGNLKATSGVTGIKYTSSNQEVGFGVAEKYIIRKGSGMSGSDALNHIAVDVNAVRVNTTATTPSGAFYYVLATPTTTEITNPNLIEQLNAIAKASLGNKNGTITTDGESLGPELDIDYGYFYYDTEPATIVDEKTVRISLTDGGVIDTCGTRQNIKLTMRETRQ